MQETRYRQRYLDGIVNHEHVRKVFDTRAKVIQKIRSFFDERNFMEVNSQYSYKYILLLLQELLKDLVSNHYT